jgi:hypothetical protein
MFTKISIHLRFLRSIDPRRSLSSCSVSSPESLRGKLKKPVPVMDQSTGSLYRPFTWTEDVCFCQPPWACATRPPNFAVHRLSPARARVATHARSRHGSTIRAPPFPVTARRRTDTYGALHARRGSCRRCDSVLLEHYVPSQYMLCDQIFIAFLEGTNKRWPHDEAGSICIACVHVRAQVVDRYCRPRLSPAPAATETYHCDFFYFGLFLKKIKK